MDANARFNRRRPLMLLAVAAMLVVVGLVSAISAPGAPPRSNKADAYGGPVMKQPTNPKSVAVCNKYYGAGNKSAEAKMCRAIAKENVGFRACAKKKGVAKAKCKAAVKKSFAKQKAAINAQQKAEQACSDKYRQETANLDPDAPDYDQKYSAASAEYNACITKATGG